MKQLGNAAAFFLALQAKVELERTAENVIDSVVRI